MYRVPGEGQEKREKEEDLTGKGSGGRRGGRKRRERLIELEVVKEKRLHSCCH